MFELNPDMEAVCYANLEKESDRIHFIGKGCWNEDGDLKFSNLQNSSRIIEGGDEEKGCSLVPVCSIDSELQGKHITFIKMDIEGAEMKALKGAEKTIRDLKPKLAISVYHKLEDMVNIMAYLSKLNPEYKFQLRHYSGCQWETVLYAS